MIFLVIILIVILSSTFSTLGFKLKTGLEATIYHHHMPLAKEHEC